MAAADGLPELLTIDEVAAACRTTAATVRWWIAVNRLPSYKVGRRRLIGRGDLESFIARGRRTSGGVG